MEDLPNELAMRIISFLSARSDLRSVRLTNKKYSVCATEHLFRTVFVHFREESLRNLMAISRQPSLSALVTEIVYEADGDIRDYWTPIGLPFHPASPGHGQFPENYLSVTLDESSRLASSLTNLPNVHNVQLQDMTHRHPQTSPADRARPTEDMWILPRNAQGYCVRSFFAMMRAASVTCSSLRVLEMSHLLHGLHYDFLELRGLDMQHTSNVFVNLTRILICIDTREGELESQRILAKGFLGKLLAAATHLQDLSVVFDQRPDYNVNLVNILGSGTWAELERLDLVGVDFHLREMGEFLRKHPTIIRIGLSHCKLHSGSIGELLEMLRDKLNLETVDFDGILGDQDRELDFSKPSQDRTKSCDFVLGHGGYPVFDR